MSAIREYVRFWDRREGGQSLALVRIGVGLVVAFDLLQAGSLDVVGALWAPIEEGGIGPSAYGNPISLVFSMFGASLRNAQLLFGAALVSALALAAGLFTRSSAAVLLICSSQLSRLSPDADRGIDTLLRNVLFVLMLSGAGATWSLDARRRTGSFVSRAAVYAWPRYLLIAQLVLLYFWAGILKQTAAWNSLGDYSALFRVLNKPHYSRFAWEHAELVQIYPLLQAGTFATLVFERGAVLVPWLLWLRSPAKAHLPLARFVVRARLLQLWVVTGIVFHIALAALTKLGIFPWGCLALYPALARPAMLDAWLTSRRRRHYRVGPAQSEISRIPVSSKYANTAPESESNGAVPTSLAGD